jgi:hypothetical protein
MVKTTKHISIYRMWKVHDGKDPEVGLVAYKTKFTMDTSGHHIYPPYAMPLVLLIVL